MKRVAYILLLLICFWVIWIFTASYAYNEPSQNLSSLHLEHLQFDTLNKGNIVAIQPEMFAEDYSSETHFYAKINAYFEKAFKENYFEENTIVLLPEYLGTWLVASNERKSILNAASIETAMACIILMQPCKFMKTFTQHKGEKDKLAATIFRMKAEKMAQIYSNVFKKLAQEYQVDIVAGSIILPEPKIENNHLKVSKKSPLYNVSFYFQKDGKIHPSVVKKVFPIEDELSFLASGNVESLPVFTTNLGKVGVLVCADSWYPEAYKNFDENDVEIILVNSFCAGNSTMQTKWQGYDGNDNPEDIDLKDISSITEQEAWVKYALPGRLKTLNPALGVNVFLGGNVWGLGSDGSPFFIYQNELIHPSEKHGIWNIKI